MPETRIYVVMQNGVDQRHRLVEATSAAQAIRHCTRNVYDAKPANPKQIAAIMSAGVRIENAAEFETQARINEQTNDPNQTTIQGV